MKHRALGAKDGMSRREFLKVIRLKTHGIPVVDKERCTGCGLCALDCETKALGVNRISGEETYQLLYREEACNACRVCEKSCPEHCLRWIETEPEKDAAEEVRVIFEDEMSRCADCGISLFPSSMGRKLKAKILLDGGPTWQFSLCPSCRMKGQFQKPQDRHSGESRNPVI